MATNSRGGQGLPLVVAPMMMMMNKIAECNTASAFIGVCVSHFLKWIKSLYQQ